MTFRETLVLANVSRTSSESECMMAELKAVLGPPQRLHLTGRLGKCRSTHMGEENGITSRCI